MSTCAVCGEDCGRVTLMGTCGAGDCLKEMSRRFMNTKIYWLNPFTNEIEETEESIQLRKRKEQKTEKQCTQ